MRSVNYFGIADDWTVWGWETIYLEEILNWIQPLSEL
jgi:hypothetical protein